MRDGVPASAERLEDSGHGNGRATGHARGHGGGNGGRSVGATFRRSALRVQGDDRLVTLARDGVAPAFDVIVERYRAPLNRYCARMVGPEHAEDVVQETFTSAYTAVLDDNRPLNLKPWLYRVAHNTAITTLRRKSWSWDELDESSDGVRQPPDHAELSERLHELVARMRTLPERQRVAIVLQELEGRSPEEIAREIDSSVPVVRQLVHRARAQLRTSCGALIPLPFLVKLFKPGVAAAKSSVAGAGAVSATVSASKIVVASAIGLIAAGSVVASGQLRPNTGVEPSASHAPPTRGAGGDAPRPTAPRHGRDPRASDAKATGGGEAVTKTPAPPGGESGSQEPAAAQPGESQAPSSGDRGEQAPGRGGAGGERGSSPPSGGEPSRPETPADEGPAPSNPPAGGGETSGGGSGGRQAEPIGGNGDGSGKGHGGGHGGGLGQGGGGGNGGGKHQ